MVAGQSPREHPQQPRQRRRPRSSRGWLRRRDLENLHVQSLQLDVYNLHSEIEALHVARRLLHARALNQRDDADGSCMRVVRQYCAIVRHGFQDQDDAATTTISTSQMRAPTNARAFLSAIMDPDARMGRFAGLEQFLRMSEEFTRAYFPVTHELQYAQVLPFKMHEGDNDASLDHHRELTVHAAVRFEVSISSETIRAAFPHLRSHERLLRQLLGRKLHGGTRFDFVFDARSHRVVRLDVDFDLVAAFAALLHDARDVEFVFHGARLSSDGGVVESPSADRAAPLLEDKAPERDTHVRRM